MSSITVTEQQAKTLTTVNQEDSLSSTWQQSCQCHLTSSNFVRVAKCNSKYEKLVESILSKSPPSIIKASEWGKSHEDTARSCYINEKMTTHGNSYKVVTTGLHICVRKSASPDGLVEDPSEKSNQHQNLLEIKCPYSARMLKLYVACSELNRFCCALVSGTPAP